MSKGKKAAIAIAVLLAVAVVSGLTTLAVTSYGSQSDPLVTMSYLNETLTPAIRDEITKAVDEKAAELTNKFNELASQGGAPGSGEASGFVVVTLTEGQTLTCGVGAELMLRIGSAVAAGPDSPRLVDETDGASVTGEGTALTVNHLYMVTIAGNGIKATAGTTKILVSGEYTIG